jgi:agmatinase
LLGLPLKDALDVLEPMFIPPEKTQAGYNFADISDSISFKDSNVVLYGVPLDLTTSFGKGTNRGPEAIRLTSARQIETFILEEKIDLYQRVKVYDLGNLRIPYSMIREENNRNFNTQHKKHIIARSLSFLDLTIPKITSTIYNDAKKIPLLIGGEHTISYYVIKALAKEKPLVIHFDAHRDMKEQYEGLKMCHTTPFFHLVNEGHVPGKNIIQIGIRQCDQLENKKAEHSGVVTFDAWHVHDNIDDLLQYLSKLTQHRKIYISFDIDVYDLPYVPCTGTPEPFGLNPFDVIDIIKSIHTSADLIGMDIVEVSAKNDDYREGTLATQTLLRILTRDFIKK